MFPSPVCKPLVADVVTGGGGARVEVIFANGVKLALLAEVIVAVSFMLVFFQTLDVQTNQMMK